MIAIIGFRYRKYTHYTLYGSCLPVYGIAIIRSLLFLFLAHFHECANICVAVKSGSTVYRYDYVTLADVTADIVIVTDVTV